MRPGLFFTKWLHAMEKLQREGAQLDEAEVQNIENVCSFLMENGLVIDSKTSIAAEMSRHWASFYDDTWVWGGEHTFLYCFHSHVVVIVPSLSNRCHRFLC